MDEIVDIVNENDVVIGQGSKNECHDKHILHRSANDFVFEDHTYQNLLLQVRSLRKKVKPGVICTPGGHLSPGETYLQGATRECFEEQYNDGRHVDRNVTFEELFKIRKTTDDDHEFITLFRVVMQGPFSPDPEEVANCYFQNIRAAIKDANERPQRYTETTVLLLNEYAKRFL